MKRRRAGFVLAGGRSSRMGRDKALLPFRGATLLEHTAKVVRAAAGSVAVIGAPERYAAFGFTVAADDHPGLGPIGGIEKALAMTTAGWNLIVACDMPELTVAFLKQLLDAAEASAADCVIPTGAGGRPEPLCAVYHRRCLDLVRDAIARGERKLTAAFAQARVQTLSGAPAVFSNLNTPADFDRLAGSHG
jgi:molybdopterin-guanine dinucleotide biosynthesis protein A